MTRVRSSLAGLLTVALLAGCGGSGGSDESDAPTKSTTTESVVEAERPGVTTTTSPEDFGPIASESSPPVEVGTTADFGGGLAVTVTEIESVDIDGGGPGTTAGPGFVVNLLVDNTSTAPVSLSPLTVVAESTTGEVARPADLEAAQALRGDLGPGEQAAGAYAFRFDGDLADVVVQVVHAERPEVMVVLP